MHGRARLAWRQIPALTDRQTAGVPPAGHQREMRRECMQLLDIYRKQRCDDVNPRTRLPTTWTLTRCCRARRSLVVQGSIALGAPRQHGPGMPCDAQAATRCPHRRRPRSRGAAVALAVAILTAAGWLGELPQLEATEYCPDESLPTHRPVLPTNGDTSFLM